MPVYDTYGMRTESLSEARELIEHVLDIKLQLHDSSYMGGDYYRNHGAQESCTIQKNFSEEEGWAEEDYQHFPLVLNVTDPPDPNATRKSLLEHEKIIGFIRRVVITEDRQYKKYHFVDGRDELVFERKLDD